jgi:hypothetical protein
MHTDVKDSETMFERIIFVLAAEVVHNAADCARQPPSVSCAYFTALEHPA